jgi:hypothetical protein
VLAQWNWAFAIKVSSITFKTNKYIFIAGHSPLIVINKFIVSYEAKSVEEAIQYLDMPGEASSGAKNCTCKEPADGGINVGMRWEITGEGMSLIDYANASKK